MKKRSAFALTDSSRLAVASTTTSLGRAPWWPGKAGTSQPNNWPAAAGACSVFGASRAAVHMALLDGNARDIGVVSLKCPDGRYPSVGLLHPPALRLERAAADLFGLVPEGLPDTRRWLDHGQWGISHPLGAAGPVPTSAPPYDFLPAEGESLHQIPVGPVHAGIIEPGTFSLYAQAAKRSFDWRSALDTYTRASRA